ncbi:MAG: hypothetical protein K0Q83_2176, partial [Deltaproteobacteria bacterium]|nr:hypothetical protein [Deltaproteobacteria bacterium]
VLTSGGIFIVGVCYSQRDVTTGKPKSKIELARSDSAEFQRGGP